MNNFRQYTSWAGAWFLLLSFVSFANGPIGNGRPAKPSVFGGKPPINSHFYLLPPPSSTVSVQVNASSDDAEQNLSTGAVGLTSNDLELAKDGTPYQKVGMRFNGLAIPQGATITNAYIEFVNKTSLSTAANLTISGQAHDNAPTFATTTNNITSRTQTAATVNWLPGNWTTVGATYQSADISTIVQEIVNRTGWSSGNGMVVMITSASTAIRRAYSYEAGASLAPTLVVEYTDGETCSNGTDDDGDGLVDANDPDCSPCATSFLVNNGFEAGLASWQFAGSTITSAVAAAGSQAIVIDNSGSDGGVWQSVAATSGEVFSLRVFAKKTGTAAPSVGMEFYDASWSMLTTSFKAVTTTNYSNFDITAMAPPNTAYVRAVAWNGVGGTGLAYFDEFCFTKSTLTAATCSENSCYLEPSFANYVFAIDDQGDGSHWMDYDNGDLMLCDNGNGTLGLKGNILNGRDAAWGAGLADSCGILDGWYVDLTLSDMQSWSEFGGTVAQNAGCEANKVDWDFWNVSGTFYGTGCNAGRTIQISAPSSGYRVQVGWGGNSQNCGFGLSTWFSASEGATPVSADIYVNLDSACYFAMRPAPCANFITNHEFNSGITNWNLYLQSGNTATLTVDNTSQLSGTNSGFVNVSTTTGTNWHIQLVQTGKSIEAGKSYNVTFQAKSSAAKSVFVALQRNNAPYTGYWGQTVNVTTTPQTFSFDFQVDSTNVGLVGLYFNLGSDSDDFWVDNVSFSEICNSGEICNNGIDDDGDSLTDCNDPDCKKITLSTPTVSACIDHPLRDVATVSVNVSWTNAPANDMIEVQVGDKIERIDVAGGATSPQTLTFVVAADGSTGKAMTADWKTNTALCATTTTFSAPAACSSDAIACNILYLCGEDKPYDGDSWDHGWIEYLDEMNGAHTVTPILTKPDGTGMGTYDAMNPSTFVNINLADYDLIVLSATTEGYTAAALVNALRDTPTNLLSGNYVLINDLGMSAVEGGYTWATAAYTDDLAQAEIYNFDNASPYNNNVLTRGDYLANGDAYLWANSGNMTSRQNGYFFAYSPADVLPGASASHGARVYLGFHMNGVYANSENGGVLPAPVSSWFSPEKHLTLAAKSYFDQAIVLAAAGCSVVPEICDNDLDDDGDGLVDCDDPDCPCYFDEYEFCTYNLDLTIGETFNIRDFVHRKNPGSPVDWGGIYFTYTAVGASNPTNPADWHLADFNAGNDVTVNAADASAGTGNHGTGEYRVYLVRNGQSDYDDKMTIRVGQGTSNQASSLCSVESCDDGIDNDGDGLVDCGDGDCPDCTSSDCADGVTLISLKVATASGSGVAGRPSMSNFFVPAGNNRVVFVAVAFEREHCQSGDNCTNSNTSGVGLGDNFANSNHLSGDRQITARFAGSGGNLDKLNPLVLPDGDLRFGFQNAYPTPPTPNDAATYYSREIYFFAIYESEINTLLSGASSGSVYVSLPDVVTPLDNADEAIMLAYVFANVDQSASGIVRSGANTNVIQGGYSDAGMAGNYTITLSDLDNGQEPDEPTDGFLAIGFNGVEGYGFNTMSGFSEITDVTITNAVGDMYAVNEGDGISISTQFRSGPSSGIINSASIQSSAPSSTIVNGGMLFTFTLESCDAVEICTNGLDDDGDGLIDGNDPDCPVIEACTCSSANLFANPGFENGAFNGSGSFLTGVPGDNLTYNWGTTSPADLHNWNHGPVWWVQSNKSSEGGKMIYLNNPSSGAVCQGQYYDIGTGVGQIHPCATYQVCFDWASFNRAYPNGRSALSQPSVDFTWIDAGGNEMGASFNAVGVKVANQDWNTLTWSSVSYSFSLTGANEPPAGAVRVRINISEHEGDNNGILFDNTNLCLVAPCATEICNNGLDDDADGLVDSADPDCIFLCPTGGLTLERWTGITGSLISNLTSNINYPNNPAETALLTDFDGPDNYADNYGTRVRGYITPSQTGVYSFNLTSDDNGELYLSTNTNAANKILIASVADWTGTTEYTKYASQTSTNISLIAGQSYYVELLHKEGGGGDHFQVYWKTPSNASWSIIPAANLRPLTCSEICNNGIDDDGDGLADCADNDCRLGLAANAGASVTICTGGVTTLTASASGGVSPYTYAWSNSLGAGASKVASPTSTTTYTVTVTSTNGCTATSQVTVTVVADPAISTQPVGATICMGATRAMSVTATGGSPSLTYQWQNSTDNVTFANISGATLANYTTPALNATTYYRVVVSASGNGCGSITSSVATVTVNTVVANAGVDATLCNGTGTNLSASASGNDGPFTFAWSNGLGSGATKTVNPASTTTYTVTVTSASSCTSTDQVVVSVNASPTANAGADATICISSSTSLTASASGGTTPYTYAWSNGLGSGATKTVNPLVTTTYTVTVTSNNGCFSTDQVTVTVQNCPEICNNGLDDDGDGLTDCADPQCGPTADAGNDFTLCQSLSATIFATSTGGNGSPTYTWNNGLGTGATKNITPSVTTTYTVTVTSPNGCSDTDNILVTVVPCAENCSNGIDDNGNGLVDCADPSCTASAAPSLVPDSYSACPALPFSERVTYNDGNLTSPVFSIASQPAYGTVSIDQTGKFTYTPSTLDCVTDVFSYQACNTGGCCSTTTVTMHLGDNTPPTMINVPADLTLNCDEAIPSPPLVQGYDACPGIFIDFDETTETTTSDACESYVITRTWTATDLCGNIARDTQRITVEDLTAPEIFRVYTLANGKKLLAGISDRTTNNWKYVRFPITFGQVPLVFSQVATKGDAAAVMAAQRNIGAQGFELRLKEEEAADGLHASEMVAWLAVEPGALPGEWLAAQELNLTDVAKALSFSTPINGMPAFIAALQTAAEKDPSTIRQQNLGNSGVSVRLQEETSADAETLHSPENLGYLAFTGGMVLRDEHQNFVAETGFVNITNAWATVTTNNRFTKPVVIMGSLTSNDNAPATIRVRNVLANSFEVQVQEWDYLDALHASEQVAWLVVEGGIPADAASYCAGSNVELKKGKDLFVVDNCDNYADLKEEATTEFRPYGMLSSQSWWVTDACSNTFSFSRIDTCEIAAVQVKAMLHGAMIVQGGSNNGLMRDNLRANDFLPIHEPYSQMPGFDNIVNQPLVDTTTVVPSNAGLVTVCHKPGTSHAHDLTLSGNALQAHLNHGDIIGGCSSSTPTYAYKTIANGNWTSPGTWLNGNVPPTGNINGASFHIEHDVTLNSASLNLKNGAFMDVHGGGLTLTGGDFILFKSEAFFNEAALHITNNGNLSVDKAESKLTFVNSLVDVGRDFEIKSGKLWLENVCLNVGEDFLNTGGQDSLINVCATIGLSFINSSSGDIYADNVQFRLTDGGFLNSLGCTFTGSDVVLWIETAGLLNLGLWTAPVLNVCIPNQVLSPFVLLPSENSCTDIADIFQACSCTGSGGGSAGSGTPPDQSNTPEAIAEKFDRTGTIYPKLLETTGTDAVVDWLVVELRDISDPAIILDYATVVLERDGHIVSESGDSVLVFPNLPEGDYYVSVRHRNHLGMMTDTPHFLCMDDPAQVDFTNPALAVRGGGFAGSQNSGKRTLWPGDFNGDGRIVYQGPYNDIWELFSRVVGEEDNVNNLANFIIPGYEANDLNLDGKVIYQGPNNDRATLLQHAVMSHPGNLGLLANYIVWDVLP